MKGAATEMEGGEGEDGREELSTAEEEVRGMAVEEAAAVEVAAVEEEDGGDVGEETRSSVPDAADAQTVEEWREAE